MVSSDLAFMTLCKLIFWLRWLPHGSDFARNPATTPPTDKGRICRSNRFRKFEHQKRGFISEILSTQIKLRERYLTANKEQTVMVASLAAECSGSRGGNNCGGVKPREIWDKGEKKIRRRRRKREARDSSGRRLAEERRQSRRGGGRRGGADSGESEREIRV